LGITRDLYEKMVERKTLHPVEQCVIAQIERDIMRSFSNKPQVEDQESLRADLLELLEVFHMMRPDISYVQGMTYPVIILILMVGKVQAFIIFANLIQTNKFFRTMYCFDESQIGTYFQVFENLLRNSLPEVAEHLHHLNIKPEMFLI
jgi:hypothetical protein